jgi:hypothetical protein
LAIFQYFFTSTIGEQDNPNSVGEVGRGREGGTKGVSFKAYFLKIPEKV